MRMQFLMDPDFIQKKISWKIFLKNFTEKEVSAFIQLFFYEACKSKAQNPDSEIARIGEQNLRSPDSKIMNLPNKNNKLTAYSEFPILFPDTICGIKFNIKIYICLNTKENFLNIEPCSTSDFKTEDISQILLKVQRTFN